jgi:hypothetical protein
MIQPTTAWGGVRPNGLAGSNTDSYAELIPAGWALCPRICPAAAGGGHRQASRRGQRLSAQETTPERFGTDALTSAGKGQQPVVACAVLVAPPLTTGEHEMQHALQRDFHPLRPIIELVAQLVDSFFEQKSIQ